MKMMAYSAALWYNVREAMARWRHKGENTMFFDKALVREKLLAWEEILHEYSLPEWEEFPSLPLYMDQVIYLLNQYLSLLPAEHTPDRLVTPAMINNYVKLKIIPAPVKKRYGRVHLAYLVIVCLLKQTLNTNEIRKVLPLELSEPQVQDLYAAFVRTFRETKEDYREQVRHIAQPVFAQDGPPVTHLIFQVAAAANLSKMLSEQSILLRGEDAAPAENP